MLSVGFRRSKKKEKREKGRKEKRKREVLEFLLVSKQQGKYSEVEHLNVRSLSIKERQLGVDHPDVATSLLNLAVLYHNTQRHPEALQSIQRAIQIYEQKLGTEHPETQKGLGWLQTIRDAM
jgi:hypothetical protein